MSKFQVGDKVAIIGNQRDGKVYHYHECGDGYYISNNKKILSGRYGVRKTAGGLRQWIYPCDLILTKQQQQQQKKESGEMFKDVRKYRDNQLVLVVDDTYEDAPHKMEPYTVARINDTYITPRGDRRRVYVESGHYAGEYRWVASEDIVPLTGQGNQDGCPPIEECSLTCHVCWNRYETIQRYEESLDPHAEVKEDAEDIIIGEIYTCREWGLVQVIDKDDDICDDIPIKINTLESDFGTDYANPLDLTFVGFEEGSKAVIVNNVRLDSHRFEIGEKVEIVRAARFTDGEYKAKSLNDGRSWWVDAEELKPILEDDQPFKEGDYVRGISNNYSFTNEEMHLARVLETDIEAFGEDKRMKIRILDHQDSGWIGDTFLVDNNDSEFKKVEVE